LNTVNITIGESKYIFGGEKKFEDFLERCYVEAYGIIFDNLFFCKSYFPPNNMTYADVTGKCHAIS